MIAAQRFDFRNPVNPCFDTPASVDVPNSISSSSLDGSNLPSLTRGICSPWSGKELAPNETDHTILIATYEHVIVPLYNSYHTVYTVHTSSSFPKPKQKVVVSVQWLVLRRLRSTDDTSAETEGKRRRMGRAGEREEREGRIEAACIIAERLRNLHACDSSIFKT